MERQGTNHKPYAVGVIFVHGIQGKPSQFDFLIERLPDDILIRNIRLPGHGATTEEFRKATSEEWLDAVREESLAMSRQCDRLIYVGHSMGCLLGLIIQQEQKLFCSMLLLCCPFCIRPTKRYLKNNIGAKITTGKTDNPYVIAAREANGITAKHATSYLRCAPPYYELLRLIHFVRTTPMTVPQSAIFSFSQLDEIVSTKSVFYARDHFDAKILVQPECGHNYFTPAAKERLVRHLQKMIEE